MEEQRLVGQSNSAQGLDGQVSGAQGLSGQASGETQRLSGQSNSIATGQRWIDAEALRILIKENYGTVTYFCQKHGLATSNVYNMIYGKIKVSEQVRQMAGSVQSAYEFDRDKRLRYAFTQKKAEIDMIRRKIDDNLEKGKIRTHVGDMSEIAKRYFLDSGCKVEDGWITL